MDEQEITLAMKSQLDPLKMNQQLKEKTLSYITNQQLKPTSRFNWRWVNTLVGLVAICLILVIFIPKSKLISDSITPASTLSEELTVKTRKLEDPLETLKIVLEQLNIKYLIETPQSKEFYSVIPMIIDEKRSYYVEFFKTVDNFDVCSQTKMKVIRLDENSLFLYEDITDELAKSLITNDTILCR